MVGRKIKKSEIDQELLADIYRLKREWMNMESILNRSIDASESGLFDLSVAKAKYFYLLREARQRKISAL
ncbi:YaaL family protein [Aquibacillus sp. 3ASR75-11]|uniref:YaaL family protein n=1 Tax=Terrihalobacillus insolitus TaxID=2950438 RepID=A0A9X4ANB0_9BACI|nr:YaaL family protein [Terrihalobacillus insolitus]MDC3415251.1 YaaL family protein [Terrihalobacillus insolitus]MDC3426322.1 YaaL family protein [Terrihalobacillus insolitus]